MTKILAEKVFHDEQNQLFALMVDDQQVYTKYRFIDDKTIEFYSTYTPKAHRGKGLAAKVVNDALDYAEENKLKIIATCWYVKKQLDARMSKAG